MIFYVTYVNYLRYVKVDGAKNRTLLACDKYISIYNQKRMKKMQKYLLQTNLLLMIQLISVLLQIYKNVQKLRKNLNHLLQKCH